MAERIYNSSFVVREVIIALPHLNKQHLTEIEHVSSFLLLFPGVSCRGSAKVVTTLHGNLSARFNIFLLNGRRNLLPLWHTKNRFKFISGRPRSVKGSNLLDLTPRATPSIIPIFIFPEIRQKCSNYETENWILKAGIIKSACD